MVPSESAQMTQTQQEIATVLNILHKVGVFFEIFYIFCYDCFTNNFTGANHNDQFTEMSIVCILHNVASVCAVYV